MTESFTNVLKGVAARYHVFLHPHASESEREVFYKRVRLLYSQPSSSYLVMIVGAYALHSTSGSEGFSAYSPYWLGIFIFISTWRFLLANQFALKQPADEALTRWSVWFGLSALMHSLVWAVSAFFISAGNPVGLVFVVTVLSGIAGGIVGVLPAVHWIAVSYLTVIVGSLVGNTLVQGEPYTYLAGLIFLYGAVLYKTLVRAREVLSETFELQVQKSLLLEQSQQEKDKIEKLNRKLESALVAAEEAAKIKARFFANMSHEIRTPMNGIVGLTNLLLESDLQLAQRANLEHVKESADHLTHLINDILDLSRIEAGKFRLNEEAFNLELELKSSRNVCAPIAEMRRVNLELTVAVDDEPWVQGDPQRVRQVVINLISNAIKFTEPGGSIAVRLLEVGERNGSVRYRLEVEDTGAGISSEALESIFAPFAQGQNVRGGTGLGLSISKNLIELMNGSIRVESEMGVGTSFFVEVDLPRASRPVAEVKSRATAQGVSRSVSSLSVLVAEDNQVNRIVIEAFLGKLGHSATFANDGLEVLAELRQQAFDLILMDVLMPELDGIETTQKIRSENKQEIPIIAITANALEGDRQKCLEAGMNGYVTKPVTLAALSNEIEKVMENKAILKEQEAPY
jgi:signal transduction histidine kinase/ActR/RegA family two-component response regulator